MSKVVNAIQSEAKPHVWLVYLSCGCERGVSVGLHRPKKVKCPKHPSGKATRSRAAGEKAV